MPAVLVMVTTAEPEALVSATEVARTWTVAGEGTEPGAVYRPEPEIVPQEEPLHPEPDRLQVTAVLVVPVTLAENC